MFCTRLCNTVMMPRGVEGGGRYPCVPLFRCSCMNIHIVVNVIWSPLGYLTSTCALNKLTNFGHHHLIFYKSLTLSVQDCWKAMQHGSKMIKLDVNRKGHHKKTFVLDADMAGIRYEPSKKNSRCKLITDLQRCSLCLLESGDGGECAY